MRYGSICSGIEAATAAWHSLGWTPAWFSENDAFPSALLAHRYPLVENYGDITNFKAWPDGAIDLLVGGTPCQSFSVAGLRGGLDDPRGNLSSPILPLLTAIGPTGWFGRTSPASCPATADGTLAPSSEGWGNSGMGSPTGFLTLSTSEFPSDAGVCSLSDILETGDLPQRYFLSAKACRGDSAPRREAGEDLAPTISARTQGGGGLGTDFDCDGGLIHAPSVSRCDATREGTSQDWETTTMVAHSLSADGFDASEDGTGRGTPLVVSTLVSNGDAHSGYRDEHGLLVANSSDGNLAGCRSSLPTSPSTRRG